MTVNRVDVLLVTAIPLERRAVREHLHSLDVMRIGSVVLDVGQFVEQHLELRVAVIEVGPGNIDASVLTTITTCELQPAVIMMVGIAGAVKDLDLGDVVASSMVYWAESGKSLETGIQTRPSFGPVSDRLVQTARLVVADAEWQKRIRNRTPRSRRPSAVVAPIVAGERVVASTNSDDAERIRRDFSDAVAVAMEDFGVTRATAIVGAGEMIAIRAASDALDGKSDTDAAGFQPVAAANAAAFAFELLARNLSTSLRPSRLEINHPSTSLRPSLLEIDHPSTSLRPSLLEINQDFYKDAAEMYPEGPTEKGVWERSGGNLAAITLEGTGRSMWWSALRQLEQGGGGPSITLDSLIAAMREDYPNSEKLRQIADPARRGL